jgi:two-component system, NarL family, nitrate/nitrite response regulator NarL
MIKLVVACNYCNADGFGGLLITGGKLGGLFRWHGAEPSGVIDNLALSNRGRWSLILSGRAKLLTTVQISLLGKNEIAREGLRQILSSENFHIKESVSDVASLMASLSVAAICGDAHVIIVDNSFDDGGLETCRAIAAVKAQARLVLLADHYVFEDVARAFQLGVDGVIIKEISCGPLIESISLVAMGEKVFPSQLVDNITNCAPAERSGDWKASAASAGLSAREVEILESIMSGMANKVIARQFDICEATVKVHVKAILRKLGVENRTQAATWAVKHGVGSPVQLALTNLALQPAINKMTTGFGKAA